MTRPGSRERLRLEQETTGRRLPVGCMAWGAVLGIIVGIMVALYALPPILRSIYGEKMVAFGEVYEAEGKRIEVLAVDRYSDQLVVTLRVRSNQTWKITEEDWQLELSSGEDWLPALPPDPLIPETGFFIDLVTERPLLLRFAATGREPADAVELHLSDPRLGFALQAE